MGVRVCVGKRVRIGMTVRVCVSVSVCWGIMPASKSMVRSVAKTKFHQGITK